MIKTTKVSLKFANIGKRKQLEKFIDEFRRVASLCVDVFWQHENLPRFCSANEIPNLDTWLSVAALQLVGKHVAAAIKGSRQKDKQRKFVLSKLIQQGKFKQARKLQAIIDKQTVSKPDVSKINPGFDSRFVKIYFCDYENSFDGHLHLQNLGRKMILNIPFRRTKHLNKLYELGKVRAHVRLLDNACVFVFDVPDVPIKQDGKTIGIDIGITTLLSCSDGKQIGSLSNVIKKMARKKKGSKGFAKCQKQRENLIGCAANKLDLTDVSTVRVEKIKNLNFGRNVGKILNKFTYPYIFGRLENVCKNNGVRIERTSSAYTSQRCSKCGWVRKANRKGKLFVCTACGYTSDADLNAAKNISFTLPAISEEVRLQHQNLKGFYWRVVGWESVVPVAQEVKCDYMAKHNYIEDYELLMGK